MFFEKYIQYESNKNYKELSSELMIIFLKTFVEELEKMFFIPV